MKLPVYVFCLTQEHKKECEAIKLDATFELKAYIWNEDLFTRENAVVSAHKLFRAAVPAAFVTISDDPKVFSQLFGMPFEIRKRWLHLQNPAQISSGGIIECFLLGNISHPGEEQSPLISCFTPAFRSGERIMRPYNSLRAQTLSNWEWVIVSDDKEDEDDNWRRIKSLAETDCRIKAFRFSHSNGYIGAVKRYAAGVCRGKWLVELDHDDDLVPQALEWLVQASRDHLDVGFIYSDFIETFEEDLASFFYGESCAFGFGAYVKQRYQGKWQNVYQTQGQNPATLRHIVGSPNHIRCWRKDVYDRIGGHNPNLAVADDYELLLRTFGATTWCHIAENCYIQYRNKGGNNFTFLRNALIQDLVRLIAKKYDSHIHNKLLEQKVHDAHDFGKCLKEFECDNFRYPRLELQWKPRKSRTISIVMPTFNRATRLQKAIDSVLAQTQKDWELYVVGDKCPVIESVMDKYTDERIRWWNLAENHGAGGAVPRNYALRIIATDHAAYLDDDNEWEPNHLETLMKKIQETGAAFVWSSMKVDGKPIIFKDFKRGRIDTSCVLFKTELIRRYGFWKDRIRDCYWHDFALFERWVKGNERWAVTMLPTVRYSCDLNGQTFDQIYNMYPDQK